MFSNTEELLPVISFNAKASAEDARKHEDFVTRMEARATRPSRCGCCASGICVCARAADESTGGCALQPLAEVRTQPLEMGA